MNKPRNLVSLDTRFLDAASFFFLALAALFFDPLSLALFLLALLSSARASAFSPDIGHVRTISADRLASLTANLGHVRAILTDRLATLAPDRRHMRAVLADGLAAFAPDIGHMLAIAAYRDASLASGRSSLVGRELVRRPLGVGRATSLARDFALLGAIHDRKATKLLTLALRRLRFGGLRMLLGLRMRLCVLLMPGMLTSGLAVLARMLRVFPVLAVLARMLSVLPPVGRMVALLRLRAVLPMSPVLALLFGHGAALSSFRLRAALPRESASVRLP